MADLTIDSENSDFLDFEPLVTANALFEGREFTSKIAKDFKALNDILTKHVQRSAQKKALPQTVDKGWVLSFIESHQHVPKSLLDCCRQILKNTEEKMVKASGKTVEEISLQKKAIFQTGQEQIGKILFLADRIPGKAAKLFSDPGQKDFAKSVDSQFIQQIQGLLAIVQNYWTIQKTIGLQDPDLAKSIKLPIEIANLLFNSNGQINMAILDPLNKTLFPSTRKLLQYEQIIQRVLTQIDSSWQPLFDAIKKPQDSNNVANEVIRADLGLAEDTPIQDLHAKYAVLAALLTQHTQGPVGDCFAVAFSIELHNEFLMNTLQQYTELSQFGSLKRLVNGNPDRFFFKLTLADDDLQKPITIDRQGHLNGTKSFLWECPSLAGSFRQMGLVKPEVVFKDAAQLLFKNNALQISTTSDAVIAAFAKASVKPGQMKSFDELLASGRYGFSSVNNRMLRAFETTLASMAEARKGDYVRDGVVQCVQTALDSTWNQMKKETAASLIVSMEQVFEKTLNDRIRFLYNAAIPLTGVSSDGSSTAGGFELYKRDPIDEFQPGTQVKTPQDFQRLILEVVDLTERAQSPSTDSEKKAVATIAKAIREYVSQKKFLHDAFVAYEPTNDNDPDPVSNYAKLDRTPMTSKDGDNPWEVEAIDTGLTIAPNIKSFQPKNCYDLVRWVLDLASWKEKIQHYLEDGVPNDIDPATSPQHAFNLTLEDEEIVSYLRSGLNSEKWIQQRLVDPNLSIANWIVDDSTKNKIIQQIVQELTQISSEAAKYFQNWAISQNRKQLSLSVFASGMFNALCGLFKANAQQKAQLSLVMDQILLGSIPDSYLKQISESSVRIAMTNWNDSDEDIYFCIYYNPRTQSLSFASINEDRSNLRPMDETEWVDYQQWEADVSDEVEFAPKP